MQLDIQLNDEGDLMTVKVEGDIDVNSVRQLKKGLEEHFDGSHPNIVIDCENLNYIDSTGLGALVSALKKAKEHGGAVRITELKPYLHKIFEVTGLDRIFEIEVAG